MTDRGDLTDEGVAERFEILQDFFSGTLPIQSAAEKLAQNSFYPEQTLELTWTAIILAARRVPEHQGKLVEFLVTLSELQPPKDEEGNELIIYDMSVWKDLPQFGWEMNSEWNSMHLAFSSTTLWQKQTKS